MIAGILFIVYALLMREILGGLAGNAFLVSIIGTGILTTAVTWITLGALAYAGLKGGQLPKWVGILAAATLIEQLIESVTIFGSSGFIAPGGAMNSTLGAGLSLITWLLAGIVASRRTSA